jgi:hypothetical protein
MDYYEIKKDLRYAYEGLEQMQQSNAGYFENFNDKQPHEMVKYLHDENSLLRQIEKLEKQLSYAIKERIK